MNPKVLVLDEPTQGVDVGAKAAIHAIIKESARNGAAVLVASTESEELVALCDRIVGDRSMAAFAVSSPDTSSLRTL